MKKRKSGRRIIGRVPGSQNTHQKTRHAQAYPFDAYGDVSDLGFADQLLLSPEVDDELKQILRECVLIDATSISDYFYQGTDQEYWQIDKDFPNVAPPYERAFFEFKAPSTIVSRENGVKPWPDANPIGWGLLCEGADVSKLQQELDSEERRAEILTISQNMLTGMERSIESIMARYPPIRNQEEFDAFFKQLPPEDQSLLAQYHAGREASKLLTQGKWDELKEMGSKSLVLARWALHITVFLKYQVGDEIRCSNPLWHFQALVDLDGQIGTDSRGVLNVHFIPVGKTAEYIGASVDSMQNMKKLRDEMQPFINTGLLTISFLHCKNVVVRKREDHILSPAQLVYHTLDIAPMRQILRTEGMEEKTGTKKALHICRGHFAHYENGRGLFGKYKGTFWIPSHVRGQARFERRLAHGE